MIYRIILSLLIMLQLSLAGAVPSHAHAHVSGELAGGTASIKTVTSADASKHGLQKSSGSNTLYDPVTQVNYAVGKDGLIYEVSSLSGFNPIPLSKPLTSATNKVVSPPSLSISNSQWGKKIRYHMDDFGLDVSNSAQRTQSRNFVDDIGSKPDQVVKGTFAGQGANGARGDALFYIKGKDVVVTSPSGNFVTVLENGVQNTSVKAALK